MVVFWGAGLYRKCDFRIPDGETGCCPRIPGCDVANAKLAATDEKARKELYRKYGIIEKP